MSEPDPTDSQRMQGWARKQLADSSALILDTETTGLGRDAEVCQIGIIVAATGQVLLDTLVRPTRPPERDAVAVHGLTMERLQDAPTFYEIVPQLRQLLSGVPVLIYNAAFDTRILEQSAKAANIQTIEVPIFGVYDYIDVMIPYSTWCGDWSEWHGNYRWQRLPGGDHTALGDCRATREVLRRMANLRDIPIPVCLTPGELERWGYVGMKEPDLVELVLALLNDYQNDGIAPDQDRRMVMWDWRALYELSLGRGRFSGWRDPVEMMARARKEIAARVAFGRGSDPLSQIARLSGDVKPGKLTKAQLEELLGRIYQVSKEGLGRE